jgi:glutathione S-transferase
VDKTKPRGGTYTLWGAALSLYTGKVRSYLIKAGIPYREFYTSHPEFRQRVLPVVRLAVAPILEAPDGTMCQDTTDIIEFLETQHPATSMVPTGPVQRVVAWLINAFGSEGLLPAAMHYRWSYREQQELWLKDEFGRASGRGGRAERHAAALKLMSQFSGMLPPLGVTPETAPAIEASHHALLAILDEHFLAHPYLLGGRPSIADFGMMASMFAHLGRDPVPANLMKLTAPNLYRWTERMNLAGIADPEFPDAAESYLPEDAIPETLEPLLGHIFTDWGPDLRASAAYYDQWVSENPGLPPGSPPSLLADRRVVHPMLGSVTYPLRGVNVTRLCAPQSLWHFEQAAFLARQLEGTARQRWQSLIERTGGTATMSIELARPMKREDYLLVLG